MTETVSAFKKANASSPVVSNRACEKGERGAHYTLEDGSQFVLSREECAMIGMPRWKL